MRRILRSDTLKIPLIKETVVICAGKQKKQTFFTFTSIFAVCGLRSAVCSLYFYPTAVAHNCQHSHSSASLTFKSGKKINPNILDEHLRCNNAYVRNKLFQLSLSRSRLASLALKRVTHSSDVAKNYPLCTYSP